MAFGLSFEILFACAVRGIKAAYAGSFVVFSRVLNFFYSIVQTPLKKPAFLFVFRAEKRLLSEHGIIRMTRKKGAIFNG